MKRLAGLLFIIGLGLTAPGHARADFFIPDINSSSSPYPDTGHFDWLNKDWDSGYDYPGFVYNSGIVSSQNDGDFTKNSNSFSITVRVLAPDNWNDSPYSGYRPKDRAEFSGGTYNWQGGESNQNFNDVYSYFYQVTQIGTAASDLNNIAISYDSAQVLNYGSLDMDSNTGNDPGLTALGSNLFVDLGGLSKGESSEWFFMTSEYWWGWQSLSYQYGTAGYNTASGQTKMDSYGNYSPEGKIPAPNPEAPTVALFLVGLGGMTILARKRLSSKESSEEA